MFKKIFEKFIVVTDFVAGLDFWTRLVLSVTSSGAISYMSGFLYNTFLYTGIFMFTLSIVALVGNWLKSKAKKANQLDSPPIGISSTEEIITLGESLPEYLSLQEAASFLADNIQLTTDKLQWVPRFPGGISMQDIFWKRDNPDKLHQETLDRGTTIPLINLCLHICKRMNVDVWGTRPSFSERSPLPDEKIKYFDADYKKLYSHIARDSGSLIYNDAEVRKEDLEYAIKKINIDTLIEDLNKN